MPAERYEGGVLRERWDDATRTYTSFDASGAQTSSRTYNAAEDAAAADSARALNANTMRDRMQAAITANSTYLALNNPTTAQRDAHIQRLTRECNALMRLVLGATDDVTGT